MFENLNKPVIVTGSMISMEEPRNDGRNNLITSLILASKYKIPEVAICFGNRILRGNRSTKTDANSIQAFSTPNYPLLGSAGVTIRLKDEIIMNHPKNPFKFLHIDPRAKVVVVKLFPGINARYLASLTKGSNIHGIILETFGIGDAPTNKGFIDFVQHLVSQGIVIVNVSQCLKHNVNETDYATGIALAKAGVISGKDMTTEAALAKVYWLLSNVENPNMDTMTKLITMPMRGEL
jgi:L-asparaginase